MWSQFFLYLWLRLWRHKAPSSANLICLLFLSAQPLFSNFGPTAWPATQRYDQIPGWTKETHGNVIVSDRGAVGLHESPKPVGRFVLGQRRLRRFGHRPDLLVLERIESRNVGLRFELGQPDHLGSLGRNSVKAFELFGWSGVFAGKAALAWRARSLEVIKYFNS